MEHNIFSSFAEITSLELPKYHSFHISQKWLRYDYWKWRGKTEKCQKWSFFGILRKEQLEYNFRSASSCKRLGKPESWKWGHYGVPKSAQKGPLKQKINRFFFIVATKIVGEPSNLKWKFLINATSFMKKFVAPPKGLHRKIWPQNPKIDPKKTCFSVHWPKNNM